MIDYNFKELAQILTKIDTNICLLISYKCTKFHLDRSTYLRVTADFVICAKKRRTKPARSYLGNAWRDLLHFWNPTSPYRRQFHSKFGNLRVKGHGSTDA